MRIWYNSRVMRTLVAGAGAVALVAALSASVLAAAPYTSETSPTTNMYWIKALTNGGGAEFVPDSSTTSLSGVKLFLASDGTPSTSHVELAVQPTCNGPSSSALGTDTVAVSGIPAGTYNPSQHWSVSGGGWITFNFSSPISLTAGQTYCIVLTSQDVTSGEVIWAGTGTAPTNAQPSWDYDKGAYGGWKEVTSGQYPAFQLLAARSTASAPSSNVSSAASSASSSAAPASSTSTSQTTTSLPKTGASPLAAAAGAVLVLLGGAAIWGLRSRKA